MGKVQPLFVTVTCDIPGYEDVEFTFDVAVPFNIVNAAMSNPKHFMRVLKMRVDKWDVRADVEEQVIKVDENGKEYVTYETKEVEVPPPSLEEGMGGMNPVVLQWIMQEGYRKGVEKIRRPKRT